MIEIVRGPPETSVDEDYNRVPASAIRPPQLSELKFIGSVRFAVIEGRRRKLENALCLHSCLFLPWERRCSQ
jgi:hypothetical protein